MAGEFAKFYIRLGTLFDPKGLKDAETKIKGTSKSVGGLSSAFTKLGAMFAGGAVIWKTISFAKEAWAAFTKQEEAVAKLNQALRNQGNYSAALSRDLQNLASDIQKVTTVGDEDSLAMMQLALSMGIAADKMEDATKFTIGLSKAYGVDLNSAMKMVALAQQGEFTMLARYIPQLRSLTSNTEKAALITKLLGEGFDLAKAEAKTASGSVKQLSNRIGDLKERIGEGLVPVMKTWVGWINKAMDGLEKLFATAAKDTMGLNRYQKASEALKYNIALEKKALDNLRSLGIKQGEEYTKHAEQYAALTKAKIKLDKEHADALKATGDKQKAAPAPFFEPGKAGPSEEDLKKDAESRLKNVDRWYLSAKGIEETRFFQWLHDNQIAWDQLDLEQKEQTMEQIRETYARANEGIAGGFILSIDRMKAAGMGWAQAWDGMWGSTLSGMTANVRQFLNFSENIFDNFRKLLDGIFKSILSSFVDMVAQMIAKWLLLQAVTGIFGAGSGIAMKLLGTRKEGGPIQETGPYLLHKDEEVLPADIANSIRKSPAPTMAPVSAAPGMPGGITLTQSVTIGGTSETDINVIADKLSQATKDGVESAVNLAKVNYKIGLKRSNEVSL